MYRETGILQQRVQIRAIGRCGDESLERIGRQQGEQEEAATQEPEHTDDARYHRGRQVRAVTCHGNRPRREQKNPQQE